jgi:phosphate uptake regulator
MYKKFMELFGKDNLLNQAIELTVEMLKIDREMFLASTESLRKRDDAELPFDIYKKDIQINKYERQVRRNVLTHLTVAGIYNIAQGLVLVSIVIDVERIGDYTKNIVELAQAHPQRLFGGVFENELTEIERITRDRFDKISEIITGMDVETAKEIVANQKDISTRVDDIILRIINEEEKELSPGNLVTLALYFRYLKRVAAHLSNVASSIVNPFPRIGFTIKED